MFRNFLRVILRLLLMAETCSTPYYETKDKLCLMVNVHTVHEKFYSRKKFTSFKHNVKPALVLKELCILPTKCT